MYFQRVQVFRTFKIIGSEIQSDVVAEKNGRPVMGERGREWLRERRKREGVSEREIGERESVLNNGGRLEK